MVKDKDAEITNIINKINENPKKFADEVKIKDLVKTLKLLSDVYYNTGNNLVSDEVYDILKDTLKDRDPTNPYLKEVGVSIKKNKVKLPYPMGSLNKIRPEKENLEVWINKYPGPYVISDKLDGVSAQYYKDPQTKEFRLYTRGDGIEGQDISHLIKYVIPETVKNNTILDGTSIRGEIIISKEDFKKISHKMKNARNTVSGVVNSKIIDKDIAKLCQFIAYSILNPIYKHDEQMVFLKEFGFKVVHYEILNELSFKILGELLLKRRKESEFDIDGIVVFDSSKAYTIGYGNPEYGFAFKTILQEQIATTKIIKVEWYPSKDRYLKPTIEVEPIELGGTTVTHATAFNAKYVFDNKLGPGAIVKIIRSGDVIPYILEVVKPAKEPQMPTILYKWNDTGVDIILKDMYGAQADIVITKTIYHFFETLNIPYIGEGIVSKLVEAGYKTIPDIINVFMNNPTKLQDIAGIGIKLIDKIRNGIIGSLEHTNLATLMAASNVFGRGFGIRRLHDIVDKYPNIMEEEWDKETMKNKIEDIKGFSDITAKRFAENFDAFKKLYNQINKIFDLSYLKKRKEDNNMIKNMTGLIIVFTGFRNNDLEKEIIERGGHISSSVSSKTSIVVKNDENSERTSKIMEAEKLNIPIMTKSTFMHEYDL